MSFDDIAVDQRGMAGLKLRGDAVAFLDWGQVVHLDDIDGEAVRLDMVDPCTAAAAPRRLENGHASARRRQDGRGGGNARQDQGGAGCRDEKRPAIDGVHSSAPRMMKMLSLEKSSSTLEI